MCAKYIWRVAITVSGLFLMMVAKETRMIGFLILIVYWGIVILMKGLRERCPNCKKWFALEFIDEESIGEENVSVKVETKTKNVNGEVTGTQEQYVPGKRITFQRNYVCKKCGETTAKRHTTDRPTL